MTSSKIKLRVWQKDDVQQLASIANNTNIWNNVMDSFPHPYTVMDAIQWVNRESSAQPITKFAIEYAGNVAGGIGMMLGEDVYRCTIELGYFIGEPFWNLGIATHALKILLQHIKENFSHVVRVYARVYEHNKASMKALQKAGFFLEGIQQKAIIKNEIVEDVFVWVKLL